MSAPPPSVDAVAGSSRSPSSSTTSSRGRTRAIRWRRSFGPKSSAATDATRASRPGAVGVTSNVASAVPAGEKTTSAMRGASRPTRSSSRTPGACPARRSRPTVTRRGLPTTEGPSPSVIPRTATSRAAAGAVAGTTTRRVPRGSERTAAARSSSANAPASRSVRRSSRRSGEVPFESASPAPRSAEASAPRASVRPVASSERTRARPSWVSPTAGAAGPATTRWSAPRSPAPIRSRTPRAVATAEVHAEASPPSAIDAESSSSTTVSEEDAPTRPPVDGRAAASTARRTAAVRSASRASSCRRRRRARCGSTVRRRRRVGNGMRRVRRRKRRCTRTGSAARPSQGSRAGLPKPTLTSPRGRGRSARPRSRTAST